MRLDEFASAIHLPVEDMVRIGEKQAVDPNSQIYKAIKLEVSKRLAAVKAVSDVDKRKRAKKRVFIQHVVSTIDRYNFCATFPNWDIKFANAGLRSAATARASYDLITEYLFEKVKPVKGKIITWGVDMRALVMRARDWAHVCVPGHEMSSQYDFLMQDRSIVAMVNAAHSRGRDPGLAKKYVTGEVKVHCTTPVKCDFKAIAGVGMFHKTDTNFRQLAVYMKQHSLKLFYFAIPGGKHMEMCTQGKLAELGAYVQPNADSTKVDIVYKGDMTLNQSFTHANYLEMIARVEVRLGDYVFRKEIDNVIFGVNIYKVTCFKADENIESSPTLYRSWVEPEYKNQYMVYAPILMPNGSLGNASDYGMTVFPVERDLIDTVHDAAMRAQGERDIIGFISRRLNSKTSSSVALHQVVQRNKLLAVTRFDLLVLVIYCSVFMRKYTDGQTVATLAPHARDIAELGKHGMLSMFSIYAKALLQVGTSQMSEFISSIRKFYYSADSRTELPLPAYLLEPGYVEYSEDSCANPRFKSWNTPDGNPSFGFYHGMPGAELLGVQPFEDIFTYSRSDGGTDIGSTIDPLMFATGDAIIASQAAIDLNVREKIKKRDVVMFEESRDAIGWMSSVAQYIGRAFDEFPDVETLSTSKERKTGVTRRKKDDGFYEPATRFGIDKEFDVDLQARPKTFTDSVNRVVNKIINDNNRLVNALPKLSATQLFTPGEVPDIIKGHYSDRPEIDMKDGLGAIFPGSLLINTQFFESDKHYGDAEFNLKGNTIKMDLSKWMPLKPESFYLPIIRGHVQPDVKNTPGNVLYAFKKRTHNTPDVAIPLDETRLFHSAWNAYLKVFCKPGTEEFLDSLPYVGPDEEAVREWVTRLPEVKKKKLESQEGFSSEDLDLSRNTLMLKQKLKPNLGASYMTSVKAPQIIQYDATNKTTAQLSPVIGRKVELEQSVLKPNILVLQRKSVEDMNKFLNGFDWRPDSRGARYYIEGDYEAFDKSQGPQASKLHWEKCAKFRVLPELVNFLKEHNTLRSVSALEAGIKAFLDVQRGSGHPDTLDGNNDVNLMVMAELLLSVIEYIEFIIVQGDDGLIAMRGPVIDVSTWEAEIARRYNLSIKLAIQQHGYICSYDIVHLPDGHSVVVADVVKRSLSFLSMSKKHEEYFTEQFISFVDSMRYIEDLRVQRYLAENLPIRMKSYLPGTTSEAIMLLCKACARLKTDYPKFRAMFSEELVTRHY